MRVPPPLVGLAAALAQRALAQRALTGATPAPPGALQVAATATLSMASVSLTVAAASHFRRSGTTVDPLHPEAASVLVTSGANALSRNPMYVGMAGLLVAHAVGRRSWAALVPVAVFVALIDRLQIRAEESALTETFGADFEAYRAAVPRWLDRRSLSTFRREPDNGG
jgi:protein-S-isoprenylcysteine O-methyltransferase Ste14